MVEVRVKGGDLERALYLFKKKIGKEGIFRELKERGLPKRSERKRKKQWIAAKRKERAKSRLGRRER